MTPASSRVARRLRRRRLWSAVPGGRARRPHHRAVRRPCRRLRLRRVPSRARRLPCRLRARPPRRRDRSRRAIRCRIRRYLRRRRYAHRTTRSRRIRGDRARIKRRPSCFSRARPTGWRRARIRTPVSRVWRSQRRIRCASRIRCVSPARPSYRLRTLTIHRSNPFRRRRQRRSRAYRSSPRPS